MDQSNCVVFRISDVEGVICVPADALWTVELCCCQVSIIQTSQATACDTLPMSLIYPQLVHSITIFVIFNVTVNTLIDRIVRMTISNWPINTKQINRNLLYKVTPYSAEQN